MTSPIDYSGAFATENPADAMMAGFKNGVAIRALQDKRAADEQAKLQQQAMQADMNELSANPTAAKIAAYSIKYPQLSEQFKRSWDMVEPAEKQAKLETATQVYSALNADKPEIALQLMRDQAKAMRNSGDERGAGAAEAMAKAFEMDPGLAKVTMGKMLHAMAGPDKFASSFASMGAEERAQALQPASMLEAKGKAIEATAKADVAMGTVGAAKARATLDNENISSQIRDRAARLGLDQDKLTSEVQIKLSEFKQKAGTLPDSAVKIVNESATAAVMADQAASSSLLLADKFDALGGGYGAFSSAAEMKDKVFGGQDVATALRQEYIRLRNSAAIKSLPPGPATDKDINLALKGFPPENADSTYIAAFMRGQAKLQQREAVFETAKAEWVNSVGSLAKPKTDIEVDGVKIPAGSTFADFSRKFLALKTEQRAQEQAAGLVKSRSYMRFATPPQTGGASGDY